MATDQPLLSAATLKFHSTPVRLSGGGSNILIGRLCRAAGIRQRGRKLLLPCVSGRCSWRQRQRVTVEVDSAVEGERRCRFCCCTTSLDGRVLRVIGAKIMPEQRFTVLTVAIHK